MLSDLKNFIEQKANEMNQKFKAARWETSCYFEMCIKIPITYTKFLEFTFSSQSDMAPFRFVKALIRTTEFLIMRRYALFGTLSVNASAACFSCLIERDFSVHTSPLAAPHKKEPRGATCGTCEEHLSSA